MSRPERSINHGVDPKWLQKVQMPLWYDTSAVNEVVPHYRLVDGRERRPRRCNRNGIVVGNCRNYDLAR